MENEQNDEMPKLQTKKPVGILGLTFIKNPWAVFSIIAICIIAVVILIRRFINSLNAKAVPQHPNYANNRQGLSPGWDVQGVNIVKECWNVLDGIWTLAITKEKVLVTLNGLSNDQLVWVYNEYNRIYYNRDTNKYTLYQKIEKESNVTLNTIREDLLARMRLLGLT